MAASASPNTQEIAIAKLEAAARRRAQPGVDDELLVKMAKEGRQDAYDQLVRRYRRFIRVKSSSYFLLGGDADDLMSEGMMGLYKAIRDYKVEREASFRGFAELCITRQIITAVKTATRNKHMPLNQSVSFSQSTAGGETEMTLEDVLPGPEVRDPSVQVIASEELDSLVGCLTSVLSDLESRVLALYLDGHPYEEIGEQVECDAKTVDNALQRVKRKVATHLSSRAVQV